MAFFLMIIRSIYVRELNLKSVEWCLSKVICALRNHMQITDVKFESSTAGGVLELQLSVVELGHRTSFSSSLLLFVV
jgi:hypothetical protein